jgi:integrase
MGHTDLMYILDRGKLRAKAGGVFCSVGLKVDEKAWDTKKKRLKGSDLLTSNTNMLLDKWATSYKVWCIQQRLEGKTIGPNEVKEALYLIIRGEKPPVATQPKKNAYTKAQCFTTYFVDFVAKIKKDKKSDANQFGQSLRVWQELFANVNANAITAIHLERFIEAAYGGGRNSTTVGGLVKKLRNVMARAMEDGYAVNPTLLKTHRGNVKDSVKDFIYLTIEQIEAIDRVPDAGLSYMQSAAKDLFLIGCCTGLRVSDFKSLTPNSIVQRDYGWCILKEHQKTDRAVEVPLNAMARRIVEKHKYSLPKMSDNYINEHIKEVAKIAGLTQPVTIYAEVQKKRIAEVYPTHTQVFSHTARRSFATNGYLAGLPILDLMRLTGHSSIKNFMRYIKMDNYEVADRVAKSEFFK